MHLPPVVYGSLCSRYGTVQVLIVNVRFSEDNEIESERDDHQRTVLCNIDVHNHHLHLDRHHMRT